MEEQPLPSGPCPTTPTPFAVSAQDLKKLRTWLRLHLPTDHPVKFVRKDIPGGEFGSCRIVVGKSTYFIVELDRRLSPEAEYLVTLHEYAHALQQRGETQESTRLEDHDGEWGLALARIWSEVGE